MWKFAELANSSKFRGRRWFFISHPNIARLSNWSCVGPTLLLVETDGTGIDGCIRSGGGVAAGAEAVEAESDAGGDATSGGLFCDFPHPPPTTNARMRQRIPAPGFHPSSLPKSKNSFIRIICGFIKR